MTIGSASLFSRLCWGLSITALALMVSLNGIRAVRADDVDDFTASLQELIADPIMNALHRLDERLTRAEATISSVAESITTRRVVAQMLCVADESGAQTCISKAQLDSLLSSVARAEINRSTQAKALPGEAATEPTKALVTKDPALEQNRTEEQSVTDQEPDHTGTVRSALSGPAIVPYPEVTATAEAGELSCDW